MATSIVGRSFVTCRASHVSRFTRRRRANHPSQSFASDARAKMRHENSTRRRQRRPRDVIDEKLGRPDASDDDDSKSQNRYETTTNTLDEDEQRAVIDAFVRAHAQSRLTAARGLGLASVALSLGYFIGRCALGYGAPSGTDAWGRCPHNARVYVDDERWMMVVYVLDVASALSAALAGMGAWTRMRRRETGENWWSAFGARVGASASLGWLSLAFVVSGATVVNVAQGLVPFAFAWACSQVARTQEEHARGIEDLKARMYRHEKI